MSGTEGVARTPVKRPRGRPRKVSQPVTATVGSQVLEAGGSFVTEVGGKMFWILKKPLAWVAALYCLAVVGSFAVQYLQNSVYGMMAPLCNIPGVGMLELPFCETGPDGGYSGSGGWGGRRARDRKASAEFPKFIELQTSFEGVLESSAGGSVMAQDLKNSEVAVRDLNTLVKHSKLASKDILSKRLDGFVAGAKEASYSLLKFSSGVRGVVDMLIALDEYAIASLENIKAAQIAGGHQPGAPSTVGSLLLAPFRSAPVDTARAEHELLVNFVKASSVMDESIKGLILQAVSTLSGLQELDDKLLVIDEIVQRESVDVQKERLELWEIWTKLGGNRHTIANLENHESLLSNLGSYRKRALAHISASLIQLQTMQADLEDLRERVATPGLIGGDGSGEWGGELPLEVHIQSIRKGVDRLSEGMKRAKTREQKHMAGLLKQHDDAIRKLGSAPPPEVNA
ncbi:hypothetical protein EDC01DRAFT_619263 [Geopyxis carbonaria]|nr:hypothetical protein EDC01DRAFT_619263 [Geopyxis carbonaria]